MENNHFNPHMDYLGLHALVCKFVKKEDEEKSSYNSTSQEIPSSPVAPLKPFEIIKLSRVYGDKSKRKPRKPISHCVFCKNNAESERVFTSHTLKDENMNITCPILRAYTCPICGSNGDTAHTIKYCPLNRGSTF